MNFETRNQYIQTFVDSMFGGRDLTPIARMRLKLRYNEWDVRLLAANDWEAMFEDEPTNPGRRL